MIDLDGAEKGEPKNLDIIKQVVKATNVPIQMGGGIRTLETIEKILNAGIARVVLGTRAIEDQNFLKTALLKWKEKIAVSLDCSNGYITTKGWTKVSDVLATTLIPQLETLGIQTLIYTDIATDGMLQGPNVKALREVLSSTKMQVITSGGISKLDDIQQLLKINAANLYGAIVGKALYEKKINLKDAIQLCSKNE
jgi:phosphoribosylformimino-5-aminoimidazole carboxamide ribotide isomerase